MPNSGFFLAVRSRFPLRLASSEARHGRVWKTAIRLVVVLLGYQIFDRYQCWLAKIAISVNFFRAYGSFYVYLFNHYRKMDIILVQIQGRKDSLLKSGSKSVNQA
jgi:hypothetical protein